jgi:hypothetical protein
MECVGVNERRGAPASEQRLRRTNGGGHGAHSAADVVDDPAGVRGNTASVGAETRHRRRHRAHVHEGFVEAHLQCRRLRRERRLQAAHRQPRADAQAHADERLDGDGDGDRDERGFSEGLWHGRVLTPVNSRVRASPKMGPTLAVRQVATHSGEAGFHTLRWRPACAHREVA